MTNPGTATIQDAPVAPDASTGTLILWLKGGAHLRFPKTPLETLKSLHQHVEQHGFSNWVICIFDSQTLAVNMAEVTAIHFDARTRSVRLVA